jgi:putative transposase
VVFFIHLHSRRVHLADMTPNPDGQWMAHVARRMSMVFEEEPKESKPTHIIRDRDTKFTAEFCSTLESDGIEFRPIPPLSPNLNPFAEAWVQWTKHEVLNHFVVFGEEHLRNILAEWVTYYHKHRPHQGLGNVPIEGELPPEESADEFHRENFVCHESLAGLLKHYERRAA